MNYDEYLTLKDKMHAKESVVLTMTHVTAAIWSGKTSLCVCVCEGEGCVCICYCVYDRVICVCATKYKPAFVFAISNQTV